MSKLLDHFKAMQEMAERYLQPIAYTDREGVEHPQYQGINPVGDAPRDQAFINDMLYMLDGPEQREAQKEER